VTPQARRALFLIRDCVAADRYAVGIHFAERMQQRGLFWLDVQLVLDEPRNVRSQGADRYGRSKWIVSGEAATGDEIEIVCAIETDEAGTEFITLYWGH
jgi:Domain of unknown function (DUF4258)